MQDPGPLMFHGEVVLRNGQPVGDVRAASCVCKPRILNLAHLRDNFFFTEGNGLPVCICVLDPVELFVCVIGSRFNIRDQVSHLVLVVRQRDS